MVKTCAHCQESFRAWPSDPPTKRFCSRPCVVAALYAPVERVCAECGQTYVTAPRTKKKWCSRACYAANRDVARFEARVDRSGECWAWTGDLARHGYGTFTPHAAKCPTQAHRFAYAMWVGPIPAGLHIDHLCFNRACVNPKHLEAVTCKVNNQRARDRFSRTVIDVDGFAR